MVMTVNYSVILVDVEFSVGIVRLRVPTICFLILPEIKFDKFRL